MKTSDAKEFIRLTDEKKKLQAESKAIQKALDNCGERLMSSMQEQGMQSFNMDGHTIYLLRDVTTSAGGNTEALVMGLRKARLGYMLQASPQKLKAWVKERMWRDDLQAWEVDKSKLPASIRALITVEERVSVCCKKA